MVGSDDTHTPKSLSCSFWRNASIAVLYVRKKSQIPNPKLQIPSVGCGFWIWDLGFGIWDFLLAALVRDHMLRVALLARQILGEGRLCVGVQPDGASSHVIRLDQDVGVFNRR